MRKRLSILVVENDHDTRVAIRSGLEFAGHFVVSAGSGYEALGLLGPMGVPDVILLSTDLPLMTTDELIYKLTMDQNLSGTPIIQIQPIGSAEIQQTNPSIKKPVTADEIRKLIDWLDENLSDS